MLWIRRTSQSAVGSQALVERSCAFVHRRATGGLSNTVRLLVVYTDGEKRRRQPLALELYVRGSSVFLTSNWTIRKALEIIFMFSSVFRKALHSCWPCGPRAFVQSVDQVMRLNRVYFIRENRQIFDISGRLFRFQTKINDNNPATSRVYVFLLRIHSFKRICCKLFGISSDRSVFENKSR